MKRTLVLGITLLVALALIVTPVVVGQGSGTMSTAFAVQNLDVGVAPVTVEFRDVNGNLTHTIPKSINEGESFNFDQRYDSGDPGQSVFQGSAIVSSEKKIGAVANMMRTGGVVPAYESYNALGEATIGTEVILPQVLKNVSSGGAVWNTTIVVQNTDTTAPVNVTLTFTPDPVVNPAIGGTLVTPFNYPISIPAGGTSYISQATTPSDVQIGAKFFGSVRVVSGSSKVAAVVYSDGSGQIVMAYPSYVSGSTDYIALPSIYKNISSMGDSYSTAILIVNFGDSAALVEIEYIVGSTGSVSGFKDTVSVPAKASKNVDQRYDAPSITSASFLGGARIKCTNGQPIAAMVNLRGGSRYGMTYGGLSSGGLTAYMPIAYKSISSGGYDWSSTVVVQNLEPGLGSANVNFTFYPQGGSAVVDPTPYGVTQIRQFDLRYDTAIASYATFIGAVKVTSAGRQVGVMVQTRGTGGSGDSLMAYLGLVPTP